MLMAFAGFLAGFIHVIAGPDHLAAVAPLALEERRRAWKLGLRWGIGHSGGVLLVGLGALLLRGILPIEALSSWSERLVGVVLIGIGLWALRKAFAKRIHTHPHHHARTQHAHVHIHNAQAHAHTHTALAVGTLHGLAGSSHILGVLPALALPTTAMAAGYMITFGAGTVLGMICFSTLIGLLASRFAASRMAVHRGLTMTCGIAAIVVGSVWLSM